MEFLESLFDLVEGHLDKFWKDHLVSRAKAKKTKWDLPSPEQRMRTPSRRRKVGAIVIDLAGVPSSMESLASLGQKRVATAADGMPFSSSSTELGIVLAGEFVGVGDNSGVGGEEFAIEAYRARLHSITRCVVLFLPQSEHLVSLEPSVDRAIDLLDETPGGEPKEAPAEPLVAPVAIISEEPTSGEFQEAQGVPTAREPQLVVGVSAELTEETAAEEPAQVVGLIVERPEESTARVFVGTEDLPAKLSEKSVEEATIRPVQEGSIFSPLPQEPRFRVRPERSVRSIWQVERFNPKRWNPNFNRDYSFNPIVETEGRLEMDREYQAPIARRAKVPEGISAQRATSDTDCREVGNSRSFFTNSSASFFIVI
ncbi:hypothetical protein Nepgr_001988 [Nepenthes gracilis]|uniref:Uncharacterized protein n=1 Tax=Nepenthes gracilis TaxID=150966 RepID=A0AAD3P5F5_NEPGR|nr:hypothetical protein Nepgr_001988 [Nepenthes gracilis]